MIELVTDERAASLVLGLKKLVIEECRVEGVTAETLTNDEPIIGGKLPLDSLDAVEIVAAIERCFGIRIENAGASRKIFQSFKVMAEYVLENASEDRINAFIQN
jgi:acyl carrier protein